MFLILIIQVIFLLDDLDELVTPYWLAMPFAKSLFQDRGVKFSNAFSSTSICCAARCQLLTGLYGHNAGVLTNEGKYGGHSAFVHPSNQNGTRLKDSSGKCINNEQRTLPLLLQQAGYKTAIWGKYINGIEDDNTSSLNSPVPPGWNHFAVAASRGFYTGYAYTLSNWESPRRNTDIPYQYYGIDEQDYCTDVVKRNSISWIQKMRSQHWDAPLFLYLASTAPHFPLPAAPRHMNSSDRWYALYNETIPNRPNWNADLTRKPFYLRDTIPLRTELAESPWFALDFVKRMGSLMAVDELIQAVYEKFEQMGELDKTVFIMTSDNGYNNGAQRLAHKMSPYEESVRIPLYFAGAGIFQGKVIDEPAVLSDLAPTILDFANLQAPSYMDGKSWLPNLLVNLNGGEKRSEVYLQYRKYIEGAESDSAFAELPESMLELAPDYLKMDIPPYRGLRTNDTLFVEYTNIFDNGTTSVEYEAYNLRTDPYELNNMGNDLDSETFDKLLGQLNQYAACSGRNCW